LNEHGLQSGQLQQTLAPVAFVLGNLTVGGSETKIVRLANRLAEQGHDTHILVIGRPYTLREKINGDVSVVCFDRKSKFSLRVLFRIKDYLEQNKIHSVLCVNPYPLMYGWPACSIIGRKKVRLISSINTSELVSFRDSLFMIIYGFILRRCDVVIFGCKRQAESWTARYRIEKSRTTVIYNGVDADHFHTNEKDRERIRQELAIGAESSVIGCVAQFRPEKCQINLLDALGRLVREHDLNVVLVLVGDGPEEPVLRQYVEQKELGDYVRFVGRVSDVRPYMSVFDVSVMPSVAVEVFSNALLESIAMQTPVISSDVGGSSEMIEHGQEGYIYPRADVGLLTEYLTNLITDRELATQFSARAEIRLRKDFTISRMDRDYVDVIWGTEEC
jgi:glycosyltransferase involved in cell wall biosynthesis